MIKFQLLALITITSMFTNNIYSNDWNKSINDNTVGSFIATDPTNPTNNGDLDPRYNNVTQSDLEEVDKFINDFLIGSTTNKPDYSVHSNNFLNSIMSNINNNRKLSYDVTDNRYNKLSYQNSNYNVNIKPVSISNNNQYNNIAYNTRPLNRNNTCKVLPSMQKYSNQLQDNNTVTILQPRIIPQIANPITYTVSTQQNTNQNQIINQEPINYNNAQSQQNNQQMNTITQQPVIYDTALTQPYGMVSNNPPLVQKLNNTNQNILTDSTIDKLLNKNTITNNIENLINNTNNNTMDNIITDSEVDRLLNNNVKNNPISDILTNEEIDKLFSNTDPNITIPMHTKKIVVPNKHNTIVLQKNTKKQNNIQVKNNKGKNNIRLTIADNNKNKKPMKKIKIPQLNINTDESISNTKCLSDRNIKKKLNTIKTPTDTKSNKRCLSKESRVHSNNIKPIRLINKKKILREAIKNNSINTNWENGINSQEIERFFTNLNGSNAYENMKMQVYSLLGEVAPSFGDTDKIRLFFDIIKYNKNNKDEKHNYNYDKALALAGTFTDYYLNNIDLYNENIEQFGKECVELATNVLLFNDKDYCNAVQIINSNEFYSAINKIVKGINFIEDFKKNRIAPNIKLEELNLSNGKRQDWFITTFKLFNYALQYSNKNDPIRNTTFSKFNDYLKNSKHRNINEKIQFIPTLKSFVKQSEETFDKIALEALYGEEDNDIGCYGVMGSIFMFRIFPELKTIFSSNQFSKNDAIIDLSNKFHFTSDRSIAKQFNEQCSKLLDIAYYDNGKKLFNNTDYLIMITNGLTRNKVINDRKYISRYNTDINNQNTENNGNKLELYELIGVQLCGNGNTNYISITGKQLEDAINAKTEFGKECINKNLQPTQALYKRVSPNEF